MLIADDGLTGLQMARENRPEVLVLDLMLPGMDGHSVCKALKKDPETELVPILMLTARGEPSERIHGLEIGADDYVTKPFSPRELVLRIQALLRDRGPKCGADVLEVGSFHLDKNKFDIRLEGRRLDLTGTEFKLLDRVDRTSGTHPVAGNPSLRCLGLPESDRYTDSGHAYSPV